jgi:hypothetical protein
MTLENAETTSGQLCRVEQALKDAGCPIVKKVSDHGCAYFDTRDSERGSTWAATV